MGKCFFGGERGGYATLRIPRIKVTIKPRVSVTYWLLRFFLMLKSVIINPETYNNTKVIPKPTAKILKYHIAFALCSIIISPKIERFSVVKLYVESEACAKLTE